MPQQGLHTILAVHRLTWVLAVQRLGNGRSVEEAIALGSEASKSLGVTAPLSDQGPASPGFVDLNGDPEVMSRPCPSHPPAHDPIGWSQAVPSQPSQEDPHASGRAAHGMAGPIRSSQPPQGLPSPTDSDVVDLCSPPTSPQPIMGSQASQGRPPVRASASDLCHPGSVRCAEPQRAAATSQMPQPPAARASAAASSRGPAQAPRIGLQSAGGGGIVSGMAPASQPEGNKVPGGSQANGRPPKASGPSLIRTASQGAPASQPFAAPRAGSDRASGSQPTQPAPCCSTGRLWSCLGISAPQPASQPVRGVCSRDSDVPAACCTLRFCSTQACTLLVLWQYFQIS